MAKQEIRILIPIRSYSLKHYLDSRCIPLRLADQYLSEAIIFSDKLCRNVHYLLFITNNLGLVYKSPWGLTGSRNAGVTTMTKNGLRCLIPTHEAVVVFSGFMDFLSYLVIKGLDRPECDAIVLNGCSNVEKGMRFMRQHLYVFCYLSMDESGRKCQKHLEEHLMGCIIVDRSDTYGGENDLNSYLIRIHNKETAPEFPRRHKSKSEESL